MLRQLFITLPLFVCCFTAVELAQSIWHRHDRPRAWLLLWAVIAAMLYGAHYVFFSNAVGLLRVTDSIYTACNLMVYPLYLLYIDELTSQGSLRRRLRWFIAIAGISIAFGIAVGTIYSMMSEEEFIRFTQYMYGTMPEDEEITGLTALQSTIHDICRVLFSLSVVLVVVIGTCKIRKYNSLVNQLYADTEEKSLHHIAIILHLLVVTAALSIIVNTLGRSQFLSSTWLALPSACFSMLLFAIGQAGLHQKFSIQDVINDSKMAGETQAEMPQVESCLPLAPAATKEDSTEDEPQQTTSCTSDSPTSDLAARLRHIVEDERMFLRHNLKLDELARQLGTNRTYLLRTMKQDLNMTFTEYINRQRIAYAQQLMKRNPEMNRADIAGQAGYASVSSFYRCLKQYGSES